MISRVFLSITKPRRAYQNLYQSFCHSNQAPYNLFEKLYHIIQK